MAQNNYKDVCRDVFEDDMDSIWTVARSMFPTEEVKIVIPKSHWDELRLSISLLEEEVRRLKNSIYCSGCQYAHVCKRIIEVIPPEEKCGILLDKKYNKAEKEEIKKWRGV